MFMNTGKINADYSRGVLTGNDRGFVRLWNITVLFVLCDYFHQMVASFLRSVAG